MPDIYAVPAFRMLQYDGTNAAAIVAALNEERNVEAELVDASAASVTVHFTTYGGVGQGGADDNLTLGAGDWVRPGGPEVIPAERFARAWIVKGVTP
jgi:hypothetical protein